MASSIQNCRRTLAGASMLALAAMSGACSSDSGDVKQAGGATANGGGGGAVGSGGAGGAIGNGGALTSGGAVSSGGAMTSGGLVGSGGAVTFGGAVGSGGAVTSGGTTASGGAMTSGGTTASGGASSGGRSGRGGAATQGGEAGAGVGGEGTGGNQQGEGGSTNGGTAGASAGGDTGSGGQSTGFSPCPTTAGTACNIMPVGDSITEGCCTAPMGGYRIELFHQALTNSKNITFVGTLTNGPTTVDGEAFPQHHEGHGGWKISQIAGVIDNAINQSDPHIILLKIGTNDINGNDNIATAPDRLASLIDQITGDAPDALLVVSAIIPTTNDGTNQNVKNYNSAIQQKAEAAANSGKHVIFVDNYALFEANANYKTAWMADGLHPNSDGYAALGQSFYDTVSEFLPNAP